MDLKKISKEHPNWADVIKGILLSFALVIFIMVMLKFFTRHGEEYAVPELVGKSAGEMEMYARDSNVHRFKYVVIDSIFVPETAGGTVMNQDPAPGQLVKKGRKIYLSVSTMNPPKVEMPNLIDLSLRQAENILNTNNLKLGQVIYKPSRFPNAVLEQRYKGRVVSQGTLLPYHSPITLVVGKEPNDEDWEIDQE